MAYTTTYSQLVADLQDYCECQNSEFIAEIPNIIARAQDKVQADLSLEIWRTFQANSVTAGSPIYTKLPDWLRVLSIHYPGSLSFCQQRSLDFVRMHGGSGKAKYWADRSETEILLAPTPLNNDTVEVEVLQKLPALSLTNEENWITRHAADLILLAALIGSQLYLLGPELVQQYSQMYVTILDGALAELKGSERKNYAPIRAAPRPVIERRAA